MGIHKHTKEYRCIYGNTKIYPVNNYTQIKFTIKHGFKQVYTIIHVYTQVYTVMHTPTNTNIDKYTQVCIHQKTRVYKNIHRLMKYTWVYTSIHVYTQLYAEIHKCAKVYKGSYRFKPGTHKYTQDYTGIHKYTQVYTSLYVYTHVCTGIHKYTRVYTSLHVFIRVYTFLHK